MTSPLALGGFLAVSFLWWTVKPWPARSLAILVTAVGVFAAQGGSDDPVFLGDDRNVTVDRSYDKEPYVPISAHDVGFDMGSSSWGDMTVSGGVVSGRLDYMNISTPNNEVVSTLELSSHRVDGGRVQTKRFGVIMLGMDPPDSNHMIIRLTPSQVRAIKAALQDYRDLRHKKP